MRRLIWSVHASVDLKYRTMSRGSIDHEIFDPKRRIPEIRLQRDFVKNSTRNNSKCRTKATEHLFIWRWSTTIAPLKTNPFSAQKSDQKKKTLTFAFTENHSKHPHNLRNSSLHHLHKKWANTHPSLRRRFDPFLQRQLSTNNQHLIQSSQSVSHLETILNQPTACLKLPYHGDLHKDSLLHRIELVAMLMLMYQSQRRQRHLNASQAKYCKRAEATLRKHERRP